MIKRYRKKPVVIEAWQNLDDNGPVPEWADFGRESGGVILIETLEGVMKAEMGDYIVKGVKNEVYPVKPEIFEQTYEEVTDD